MLAQRLTVPQLLQAAPVSRYVAELTGCAEYGVRGIFRDSDDTLEVRVYTGSTPWGREQATEKAEAARAHQRSHGLLDDARLVTRVGRGPWRPAIAA